MLRNEEEQNEIFRESYEMFSPAPGVIQTNPVIIPWMAPITEGFLKKITSQHVHTRRLVDAQMWVLRTAMEESTLALKGSPPLKPLHPIQRIPAPANASKRLLGGNCSRSSLNLGPTYREDQESQIFEDYLNHHQYFIQEMQGNSTSTYPISCCESCCARS
jgi:hypothetical protein